MYKGLPAVCFVVSRGSMAPHAYPTCASAALYKSRVLLCTRIACACCLCCSVQSPNPSARSVHLLRALARLVVLVVVHHRRSGDGTRDAPRHTLKLARPC